MSAMASELLTVIVASVSCVAFCLMVLMLVVVFYRKDPLCCRFRPHNTEHYADDSPHYHSRHSLISVAHAHEHGDAVSQGAVGPQPPGRMFVIGKPSDYHLNEALPRLPSYESVRKRDRQRLVHTMISQRFGLGSYHDEPPPTYEETLHQSLDISPVHLHPIDVHLLIHTHNDSPYVSEETHSPSHSATALQGPSTSDCPAQSSRFLSI